MKITSKALKELGFTYEDLADEPPYEQWERDGVVIWDWNGEHWLVDALDQAGIHVEFETIECLDKFWCACRLPPLLPNKHISEPAEKKPG